MSPVRTAHTNRFCLLMGQVRRGSGVQLFQKDKGGGDSRNAEEPLGMEQLVQGKFPSVRFCFRHLYLKHLCLRGMLQELPVVYFPRARHRFSEALPGICPLLSANASFPEACQAKRA